jgi:hypothetical protein
VATDPRRLRPGDLCRLVNSTPLGEVLTEGKLRTHRTRAGHRVGDAKHIDLLKYTAWLVTRRHAVKEKATEDVTSHRLDDARGAAAVAGGKNGSPKQERVIAALLTEPSYAAAAEKADVSETTLYRWLNTPAFRTAFERARRELIAAAVGRLQAASGEAVDALTTVAKKGRREGDRVRAANALLEHAWRGLSRADLLRDLPEAGDGGPTGTAEVVKVLVARLRQLESVAMPAPEKARLTVTLSDALLRALGVDEIEKRLAALEGVLSHRSKVAT